MLHESINLGHYQTSMVKFLYGKQLTGFSL